MTHALNNLNVLNDVALNNINDLNYLNDFNDIGLNDLALNELTLEWYNWNYDVTYINQNDTFEIRISKH